MGLGLAISQKLAQRMTKNIQGGIRVSSDEGHGSDFWFPLEISNHNTFLSMPGVIFEGFGDTQIQEVKDFQKDVLSKRFPQEAKRNILVVDDDMINLLVLKRYLKSTTNIIYDTAINGQEALKKIKEAAERERPFHLIFMDCHMPIMDGYDCSREIRMLIKRELLPQVKVIALTGAVSAEEKDLCFEAGMADVISKPISKSDFLKKIAEELKKLF